MSNNVSREPFYSEERSAWLVPLTQGMFALIDPDDAEEVGRRWWYASNTSSGVYAKSRGEYLHHRIMGKMPGMLVDHISGDTLDNRRHNLRFVTPRENAWNQHVHHGKNTSGYRGVNWHLGTSKWRAYIKLEGRYVHLGLFDDIEEAALVRDNVAMKHFGDDAFLNLPERKVPEDD